MLGATSRDHDTCRGWRWDKEQRDEGQRLGQRPTESGRGRGRSQSSDILSFEGLKATEIPHRKRKGKRKGLGQMRVPCCLSVCRDRHGIPKPLCFALWHGFSRNWTAFGGGLPWQQVGKRRKTVDEKAHRDSQQ